MPSTNDSPTPIAFCDRSALQILRAAQAADHVLRKSALRKPPEKAPLQKEILAAIYCAEADLPGLRLQRPVHVLVSDPRQCRASDVSVVHSCSATLTKGSFLHVGEGAYVCVAALSFVRAACQGVEDIDLLELGFELCGSYRTLLTCGNNAYNVPALTTARELRDYALRNAALKGARTAARLAETIADGSASPRETKLALLMGLPLAQGGAGLGMPVMNYELLPSREAALIARRASFRCDLCWPKARLDVEYQSREMHSGEERRISDSRREHALEAMDWNVINVTNDELDSMTACDVIAKTIRRRLGKDPRIRVSNYYERQLALRGALDLPV